MSSPNLDSVNSACCQIVGPQGLRPAPLMIQNQSRKTKKSPKKPVIIYMVSPKIIHAEAGEFMALVQRLTGLSSNVVEGESSGSRQSFDSQGKKKSTQLPIKVKARALNHSGSVPVKSTQQPCPRSPTFPTLFSQELSPIACGGDQKGGSAVSQNWFSNGDGMSQSLKHSSGDVVGSSSYLDLFKHAYNDGR